MKFATIALTVLGVAALATQGTATAQSTYRSPTTDRVRFSFGLMQESTRTDFRIDSTAGQPGTLVNAEDDLGLDKSRIGPKFQALLRFGERNRLRFDYFRLERNGFKVIDQPVAFRDVNLIITDPVHTDLNLKMLSVTYGYSFWRSDKLEIAGTFGVNLMDIDARVRVQQDPRRIDERETKAGPFPQVGIDLTWAISHRFYIDTRAQYLKVNINEFDGSIGFYEFAALYRWRPNMSFGLGVSLFKADVNSVKLNESGFFKFNTNAPEAFVRVAF
jgi:hypothetical protein